MFCANCGTENDDGAAFCSKCGKSPAGGTATVNQKERQSGYPLSNLTAKLFGVLFEIILWIILLGGIVGGGILGKIFAPSSYYRDDSSAGYIFGGIILGGIAGFITIILTGGLVSLFIKLVNNSEDIKKKLK